jgi:hypothetical protein
MPTVWLNNHKKTGGGGGASGENILLLMINEVLTKEEIGAMLIFCVFCDIFIRSDILEDFSLLERYATRHNTPKTLYLLQHRCKGLKSPVSTFLFD